MRFTLALFAIAVLVHTGNSARVLTSATEEAVAAGQLDDVQKAHVNLELNQYISTFYNRLFRSATGKEISRYRWFTPLYCAKSRRWFEVTAAMVEKVAEHPCILVTCDPSSDLKVQGELLADCGAAKKIANQLSYGYYAPDGLRVLSTGDPMVLDKHGNIEAIMSRRGGIATHAVDLMEDEVGYLVLHPPHYQVSPDPPKTRAWSLNVDSDKCKRNHVYKDLEKPVDLASKATCLKQAEAYTASCSQNIDARLEEGVDWYLNYEGRKTKIMLTTCEEWANQNIVDHFMRLFGVPVVSREDCQQAFEERMESEREYCAQGKIFCEVSWTCAQQASLPSPELESW